MLVTFDQTIAVLGDGTPHRHKVLDLIESRHITYLVGIAPDTHDLALDTTMLLLHFAVEGDVDAPSGVPISAVQVHTLFLATATWLHDFSLGTSVANGKVGKVSREVQAAGASVGAADVKDVVAVGRVGRRASDVEVEPSRVFGDLSLSTGQC